VRGTGSGPDTAKVTTAIAARVERRKPAVRQARTTFGALADVAARVAAIAELGTWPSTRYQKDPVAFAREVLGVEPWSKQREILEAVRDHKRVAVVSGHKVGKSRTDAIAALWFYCSFPDARVVLSSVTSRQVDQILWRELCKLRKGAKRAIDGEIHELARSGLKAADFREIVGFTAKEAEAVAGISGQNLFYILDEASGIPDAIFEAIEGNRAGGARVLMTSNPTRTDGAFFDAFHDKARFYKTVSVSSEESPNVIAGREIIPGLALREWVEEKREEWGEDSPLFKVRVKGEFCLGEDGKIMSLHAITESEARWVETRGEGRLQLGLDPAGETGSGDETACVWRRGKKVLGLVALRGLSPEAHVVHVAGLISTHRVRGERPLVVCDKNGLGAKICRLLRERGEEDGFDVVGVSSSDKAIREPKRYWHMRDELHANAAQWIRDGGALLEDAKLAKELHAPSWIQMVNGPSKVTPKIDIKKLLGRSPDRGDAFLLSVWEPTSYAPVVANERPAAAPEIEDATGMDPYAAMDTWGSRR